MEDHDGEECVPLWSNQSPSSCPPKPFQLLWLPFQERKAFSAHYEKRDELEDLQPLWIPSVLGLCGQWMINIFPIKKRNFATTWRLQSYSEHWIMFVHIGVWWLLCRNLSDFVFSSIFNPRSRKKGELFAFFYTIMDSNQMLSSCSKLKSWMNCKQTWDFEESEILEEMMAYT